MSKSGGTVLDLSVMSLSGSILVNMGTGVRLIQFIWSSESASHTVTRYRDVGSDWGSTSVYDGKLTGPDSGYYSGGAYSIRYQNTNVSGCSVSNINNLYPEMYHELDPDVSHITNTFGFIHTLDQDGSSCILPPVYSDWTPQA